MAIKLIRTGTALVAGAALFASVSAGAFAGPAPTTFTVTTTIAASCTVSEDGAPGDLTPTYNPTSDTSTGSETTLTTFCNGTTPTVTFTDATGNFESFYTMLDGNNDHLNYQLSNTATCTGVVGDNNLPEGDALPLTSPYEICAAVIPGQTTAPAGTYVDTVTYNIAD
jgi:spore coat protein U-like protein